MSRRARVRQASRPWNLNRPETDTSGLEQALAAVAAERQRREHPTQPKGPQ